MGIVVFVIIFIITGIIYSRIAGFIGSEIFKFSEVYKFFRKLFRKSVDK
jgi:hypothetical protein